MKQNKLWLTTIATILCCLSASAHDFEVDGIYYKITNSTDLTVAVTTGSNAYSGAVIIPSTVTYNGKTYSVTSIENYTFYYCTNLTSIILPESVTSIGNNAFGYCEKLTSINIPEGVTSIEYHTFYACSNLTSITIPEGVTSIGGHAFYGCSSLTSITLPVNVTSIGNYAFAYCESLTAITIPEGVTSIGGHAFFGCSGLTSITIPEGVTSIGESAFSRCSSLASITVADGNTVYDSREGCNAIIETNSNTLITGCSTTIIPVSVTSIGNDAFAYCESLTSITIPESVTDIGESAFLGCSGLTSITISESVASIGNNAFSGTAWYSNLPDGVIYVGKLLYRYKGEMPENTSIEVKEGTLSISSRAFASCRSLTSIIIPESVTSIEDETFYDCINLTSITMLGNVTSIGGSAFYGCRSLTSIIVPRSVTSIGERAFCYCSSLTSITIPESVTRIENDAFRYCTSLKDVFIEDGSSTLSVGYNSWYNASGTGLFYDCPLESVYLGRNLSYSSEKTHGYSPFYHKERSPTISLGNRITTIPSHLFYNNASLSVIIIPEGVTSIGRYAFCGCSNLRVSVIPTSVTSIDYWAFSGCSNLKVVVFNTNIGIDNYYTGLENADRILKGEYIDGYIFSEQDGAYALAAYVGEDENLILPEAYKGQGYSIGDYAFHYCPNLTTVTIPDGVTSIGYAAFSGTSLTSVEIPASVQSIARGVFCEYEKDDALLKATPLRTVIARSHTPARMIDGVPAEEQGSDKNFIFSNYTYIHAPLYVPEGAYWDYAYAIGWGDFINIKEMVTEADNLQSSRAYMIADAEGCNYTVYDVKKKRLENVAYTHSLDEKSEDCCWTVLREDGKTYLYSLGAKKFATITNGAIALSDTPVSVTITDDEEGLNVDGSNFMFVLNKNIKADVTVKTKYLVTFKIGDEVIAADSLEYGAAIVAPEAPEREGYTFSGWGEVAAVVPANDLIYEGSYTVNSYLLTYTVDGETVQSDSIVYGAIIALIDEPTKEGHTFSGWSEAPETMPAEDLTISGTFTVNTYKVYYYVGEELVHTAEVAYGEAIPEYTHEPTGEGDVFEGWVGETYATMPAHDVTYVANITNGIEQSAISNHKSEMIFDLMGRKVTDTENLKGGVYIINGRKVVINVNDERLTKTTVIIR